jgi:hypothetical protein
MRIVVLAGESLSLISALPSVEYDVREHHNGGSWLNWCLDFPNGWTLSIRQYGPGSYSSDNTVELLAWSSLTSDAWERERGWQDMSELLDAISEVANY